MLSNESRSAIIAVILCILGGAAWSAEPAVDLRVLIDVSGSMKKNDPANLRAPAMRLLVGLLPEGSRVGIWSFGEYVNELAPLARVDGGWKKAAGQASKKITSREMFTDIELALLRGTSDWKTPDPAFRRSVILLTDGLVDVDKDPALNADSRRRLLEDILPRLQASGAALHTISLSEHADHEMLKKLAMATDGGYVFVDSAERLNRVFVSLFEKSAPADSVPLNDNRFSIDDGIRDMTLLVFRDEDSGVVGVVTPDGQSFSAADHPDTVHWHAEQGYDLVTVEAPVTGEWALDAAVDPDNRVMVVTNLKLRTEPLPNNLFKADRLQTMAWLAEGDRRIDRAVFLRLVGFSVNRFMDGIDDRRYELLDDGAGADGNAADGVYSADLGSLIRPGEYLLVIRAEGKSFQREIRHTVQVHEDPASIELLAPAEGGEANYLLKVEVRRELVDLNSVSAVVRLAGNAELPPELPMVDEDRWELGIAQTAENQIVELRVEGKLVSGRLFKLQVEKLIPALPAPVQSAPESIEPAPPAPVEESLAEPGEQEKDGLWYGLVIGIVNLFLVALLVVGYLSWKKRGNDIARQEEDLDL